MLYTEGGLSENGESHMQRKTKSKCEGKQIFFVDVHLVGSKVSDRFLLDQCEAGILQGQMH